VLRYTRAEQEQRSVRQVSLSPSSSEQRLSPVEGQIDQQQQLRQQQAVDQLEQQLQGLRNERDQALSAAASSRAQFDKASVSELPEFFLLNSSNWYYFCRSLWTLFGRS
jgi:hypothetical protein